MNLMHSGKMTKIIATIGPSSQSPDIIRELILEGVNIFRFNTKHNTNEWHFEHIKLVKKIADEINIPIGVLVDLQGPEIRLDTLDAMSLELSKGDTLELVSDFAHAKTRYSIKVPALLIETLKKGDKFSIDDGFNDFEVTIARENNVKAVALENAKISNRKGLNLLEKDIELPSLTARDRERLSMAKSAKADFIALSFVRSKRDVELLRREMGKHNLNCRIVAKIESQRGVENINEIIEVSDAIMIARGDLGIEIPIERVTHIQKELIKKCRDKSKPVIVATQMLQSMIESPRPTRAEAADVANAVYDETDCVMLSGETASGKFPVKTVSVMRRILQYNESKKQLYTFEPKSHDQTHLIASAAMSILKERHEVKVDRILIFTETGHTATVLGSYRPHVPIIALSDNESTVNGLTMSYGVGPFYAKFESGEYKYPKKIVDMLLSVGILQKDSTILIIHGRKWKEPGGTNALVVVNI